MWRMNRWEKARDCRNKLFEAIPHFYRHVKNICRLKLIAKQKKPFETIVSFIAAEPMRSTDTVTNSTLVIQPERSHVNVFDVPPV